MLEPKNTHRKNKVIVIGAGIAGLAAAYFLKRRGIDLQILEKEKIAGGELRSVIKEERYIMDLGPSAFLGGEEPVAKLARELSIEPQIVGGGEISSKRFIFSRNTLYEIPQKPSLALRSGLLSLKGKARLLVEPLIRSKSQDGESVADFVLRRGGREALESFAEPIISARWAGDAGELEAESVLPELLAIEREEGSLLRNIKKSIKKDEKQCAFSFRWGMGTLTARLEEELRSSILLNSPVQGVEKRPDGVFRVKLENKYLALDADAVLMAAPSHAAAKVLMPLDKTIFEPLSAIKYAPLVVVHTVFNASDIKRNVEGFGILVPRREGMRILGISNPSAVFPSRCPRSEVLLTTFMGGAMDPSAIELLDSEIEDEVLVSLGKILGVTAKPKFKHIKRWNEAIPQYTIGHKARIGSIVDKVGAVPGAFITGSYLDGVSISDTIQHARKEVDKVLSYIKLINR